MNKELKTEIKNYINHADDRMLKLIHAIIEADQDWWDEISIEEKQQKGDLGISTQNIQAGNTAPNLLEQLAKH